MNTYYLEIQDNIIVKVKAKSKFKAYRKLKKDYKKAIFKRFTTGFNTNNDNNIKSNKRLYYASTINKVNKTSII